MKRMEFYIEKYANHQRDMKHAMGLIERHQHDITILHDVKNIPHNEMAFIFDANATLVDCRNVLRYTYAYAFFCIHEKSQIAKQKKEFFEFV